MTTAHIVVAARPTALTYPSKGQPMHQRHPVRSHLPRHPAPSRCQQKKETARPVISIPTYRTGQVSPPLQGVTVSGFVPKPAQTGVQS